MAFPFTLSTLPLLEHLTIQVYLHHRTIRPAYLSSLPTIVQLLLTASPSLKRVDLQVDLYILAPFPIEPVLKELKWSSLNALIPLKSIHPINLCVGSDPDSDSLYTQIDPAKLLYILERNAILSELLRQGTLVLKTK